MPTSGRRTATKLLRLHPDELARITAQAKACGLNSARYIRERALGATPKARHHADTDRLLRALASLGRKLEQAAELVRSKGDAELAEQVATAVDGHRAIVAQVVALGVPRGPAVISATPQMTGAAPRCARGRPSASRRAKRSRDQLTIDFHPAPQSAARLQAAAAR